MVDDAVAGLRASVQRLSDEVVDQRTNLARQDTQLQRLTTELAERDQALRDLQRATTQIPSADRQLDALRTQDIVATTLWVERLPSSDALVSVVMPTHNRPHLLREAIASVLDQTHANFELLIVDDGSTPETAELLEEYDDPRIRCFRLEPNSGGSTARNAALARVHGRYVTYLDDDNLIGRSWLRAVIWAFETNPALDVAYGAMVSDIDVHPEGLPFFSMLPWDRQRLVLNNFVDQGSIAHRAGLHDAILDETTREAADWDLMVRLTEERDAIRIPVVAVHYRTRHGGRISGEPTARAAVARLQQRFARRGPLRVLVLVGGAPAGEGASPAEVGRTMEDAGERVSWCHDVETDQGGVTPAGLARVEAAIRATHPDIVLTAAGAVVEAHLQAWSSPYVAFAAHGVGRIPEDPASLSLGEWDSRSPWGTGGDAARLRAELLRQLDRVRSAALGIRDPGVLDEIPADHRFPVAASPDIDDRIVVLRDDAAVPSDA